MSVLLGGRNGATTCKEVHAPEVSPPPPNRADTQMQVKIYSCTERFGYPQLSKRNSTHTQLNPAGAESSFRKVNLPPVKCFFPLFTESQPQIYIVWNSS